MKMEILDKHIDEFRKIKEEFITKTSVPKQNNWKERTDNELWHHLIGQIITVGGSLPAEKFGDRDDLKKEVSYGKLIEIENQSIIKKMLNKVLRQVGTRYASKDIEKCRKTNALAHNLKILKSFKGPKKLLQRISEFKGKNSDLRKVKYLMKVFRFIQSKSARDYLMELGLVRNAVALDVRILNILKSMGIKVPKEVESNSKTYDYVEKIILERICDSLNLEGIEFDRMLYQNYKAIIKIYNKS